MVVVALVVVVAGSLLTLAEARLEEVSASAVTERADDSDAFLHDSALFANEKRNEHFQSFPHPLSYLTKVLSFLDCYVKRDDKTLAHRYLRLLPLRFEERATNGDTRLPRGRRPRQPTREIASRRKSRR